MSVERRENDPAFEARVRSIFTRACDAPDAARREILGEARRNDPEACVEAEQLLRYHERCTAMLDESVLQVVARMTPAGVGLGEPVVPAALGSYRVVREIGRGGMGVVYEAEQESPRRRVALKVIRPELVTTTFMRRFRREAEVLARLHHPAIAQVYEAGFGTGAGQQPFIAMELVEGRALTKYITENHTDVPGVLRLMERVCDAVDHAHHRGVVHRDLKPGNILVGADGLPKVLDFGVARLTVPDTEAMTVATHVGQIIGTLGYMSPEQFGDRPDEVDPRSDVYALGVILFEALTGALPIDMNGLTIGQAASALRSREPALLGKVRPSLRGDVEAIVAKALERDPDERYHSAAELGSDIRRFLNDEPVSARAQTTWYQARKFARRNRGLVAGVAGAFALLAASLGLVSWQAGVAGRARAEAVGAKEQLAAQVEVEKALRARAQHDAETSRAVTSFLREVFNSGHPEFTGGKEWTLLDAIERAAPEVNRQFKDRPEVRLELLGTVASVYSSMGKLEKGAEYYAQAMEVARRVFPDDSFPWAITAASYADTLISLDRFDEAETLLRGTIERLDPSHGAETAQGAKLESELGSVLKNRGQMKEAEQHLRHAFDVQTRLLGEESSDALVTMNALANLLQDMQRDTEAEAIGRKNWEIEKRISPPEHPDRIAAQVNYAAHIDRLGRHDEAIALIEEVLPIAKKVYGESNPQYLAAEQLLASAQLDAGRAAEATVTLERVARSLDARFGPESIAALSVRNSLSLAYERSDQPEKAAEVLRGLLDVMQRREPNSSRTLVVMANLARVTRALGNSDRASTLFRQAVDLSETALPPAHPFKASLRVSLAEVLLAQGRASEADSLMLEAYERAKACDGGAGSTTAKTCRAVADALEKAGRKDEAAAWRARAPETPKK